MQMQRHELIEELIARTEKAIATTHQLKELGIGRLNAKRTAEEWSALECFEHLNRYGDFYLPEIEKKLLSQKATPTSTLFKSGWLGNYFAKLMQGKDGKIKKLKSPKDKNPAGSVLTMMTADRFIKQLAKLKYLLNDARQADLTKIRTAISITQLIQLRLGDTFRFFIFHIERHIAQAERAAFK